MEQTKSNNLLRWTTQSNNLNYSVVPFMDNVVNKDPITGKIILRTYSTGTVEFGLRQYACNGKKSNLTSQGFTLSGFLINFIVYIFYFYSCDKR
jgi:hypothetical protein